MNNEKIFSIQAMKLGIHRIDLLMRITVTLNVEEGGRYCNIQIEPTTLFMENSSKWPKIQELLYRWSFFKNLFSPFGGVKSSFYTCIITNNIKHHKFDHISLDTTSLSLNDHSF